MIKINHRCIKCDCEFYYRVSNDICNICCSGSVLKAVQVKIQVQKEVEEMDPILGLTDPREWVRKIWEKKINGQR